MIIQKNEYYTIRIYINIIHPYIAIITFTYRGNTARRQVNKPS